MLLNDIIKEIERVAPTSLQEGYDNAGLIVGDYNQEITQALICLDTTEEVVEEAIANKCELIIAHHPIVFKGLKSFTGKNYVERVIIKAIQNNIAIYAAHTNLDNVYAQGVNRKIANKLGLTNTQILAPKSGLLSKLQVFCPKSAVEEVRNALFSAGGGEIGNYDSCSFNTNGEGTFRGNADAKPFVGDVGTLHVEQETKIELVFETYKISKIVQALKKAHPYEEVAYDIIPLGNTHPYIGSGMIGELEEPMEHDDFLRALKSRMQVGVIRHTKKVKDTITRVAICGGSGSFLLKNAKAQKADIFITGDFKYHEFFDAENDIVIADIGHYESEQFTSELFCEILKEKFPTFALRLSEVNTNPINYYY